MENNQEKQTYYISGAITGMPNLNKEKFYSAAWIIKKDLRGIPINPHELPNDHDGSWFSYMKVCIRYLTDCDRVIVLDCWKKSRGAVREVIIAKWLNIPVVCIEKREPVRLSAWLVIKLLLKLI